MKILSVVGARPQFVKLAPVNLALRATGHEHMIVHTGQHYDPELSGSLFADLDIPAPDVNLGIGSASHARQTALMLEGLEQVIAEANPDWVLTYGDTNSTLAAALAAVKMQFPLAHLEAGLRSGNRLMPEEHNRVVTDHVADLLLAPTMTAMRHLADEGLARRSVNVGDVMTDICFRIRDRVSLAPPPMPDGWTGDERTLLATIHRAENTDSAERLSEVLTKLNNLAAPVLLVAHPRRVAKCEKFGIPLQRERVTPIPSMTYSQMSYAVVRARGVITDSGGLQKEAFLLKTPCVTVRTETEWPETLVDDWNVIDPFLEVDLETHLARRRTTRDSEPFGSGDAAQRAIAAIEAATQL